MIAEDMVPEPQALEETATKQKRILIVDDDRVQNEILEFCFQKLGYEPITAECGVSGLEKARTILPELILLDINMPGVSGLDVCRSLSDDSLTSDIPIIILSGSDFPDVVRNSRSAGCRYYIRKPYDPNALLTLAQSALDEADKL